MLKLGYRKSRLLRQLDSTLSLWLIGYDELLQFSKSVFNVYSETYGRRHDWHGPLDEFGRIVMEDTDFARHSAFFAIRTSDGTILTTGRITRKHPEIELPIEGVFNIDLAELASARSCDQVYHAGRLTSNSALYGIAGYRNPKRKSMEMLRALHELSVGLIAPEPSSMFVGELDVAALRFYRQMLKLPVETLGPAMDYLGSPTLPVVIETRTVPGAWVSNAAQLQATIELAS